jgi:hypothetical protein
MHDEYFITIQDENNIINKAKARTIFCHFKTKNLLNNINLQKEIR